MSGEHHMVAYGMIVGVVSQGPAQGPEVANGSQSREVFADLQARRLGSDWEELTTNFRRGVGFKVKAFVLCKSA